MISSNAKEYRKKKHKVQQGSVFEMLRRLSYYLNVTDPLIIPIIFIFLSCGQKANNSVVKIQNLVTYRYVYVNVIYYETWVNERLQVVLLSILRVSCLY